jgi:hypothetical protein
MTKVKKITVSNLKAISKLSADFNGCTAIITGGNNKGKSSFLRSLPDRIRGIKPDIIIKNGESEGFAEWELITGEKFIWSFDTKTKAGERLQFITKDNIKSSVTKEIAARYFPPVFDVDDFLAAGPKKQNETLQKLAGIDFGAIEARHKAAYEDRTYANKKADEAATALSLLGAAPEKVEVVDIAELTAKKESIRQKINDQYKENKKHNEALRESYDRDKQSAQDEYDAACDTMDETNAIVHSAREHLSGLISLGYTGSEVLNWIDTLTYIQQVSKKDVPEPEYINEMPDDTELREIDEQINTAHETNRKADAYANYLKQKEAAANAKKDAEEADKKVKGIEKEKLDLIKSAKMPEGFGFTDDGISYNGLPFTREQLSSSGIYIAALKLANMTIGEVKTLHFDASFLDNDQILKLEKLNIFFYQNKKRNMAVTILEALQNAQINLVENKGNPLCFHIGKEQLHNAIMLLEKGYSLYDEVEVILEGYNNVEDVPTHPKEDKV